jgi:hypothetical protein
VTAPIDGAVRQSWLAIGAELETSATVPVDSDPEGWFPRQKDRAARPFVTSRLANTISERDAMVTQCELRGPSWNNAGTLAHGGGAGSQSELVDEAAGDE